jgi:uncharacterized membrane protein YraQ (UPF0718 family)
VYQDIQDFVLNFSSILWEAMPFIVLGAVLAGVLEELLPQQLIGKVMPNNALAAVVIGGLLGLVFPMCECGIVVVMRRLLRKGMPLACCISYMLAGPILNVVVLLSTYMAFGQAKVMGVEMVLLRAGLGFLVACVTGLVVFALEKKYGTAALLTPLAAPPKVKGLDVLEPDKIAEKKSVLKRLGNISETALHDFVDITVFLILGATLAALTKMFVSPDDLTRLSQDQPFLAIPAMMVLAVLMCLCSEADAFVAASFTEMSVSSKLAFLVLGPMFDLKLLMMFTRVFRPRLIAVIVGCTVTQVLLYTMIVHPLYNPDVRRMGAQATTIAPSQSPSPTAAPTKP